MRFEPLQALPDLVDLQAWTGILHRKPDALAELIQLIGWANRIRCVFDL